MCLHCCRNTALPRFLHLKERTLVHSVLCRSNNNWTLALTYRLPTAPQFWWIWLLNKQRLHIQASLSHSIVGHLPWFLRRPPGAFHQTPLLPIPNCVFTAAKTQPCLGFPTWKNDCTFNSPSSKSLIGHLPQFLGCQLFRSSGGLPRVISFHPMARTPDVR